MEPRGNFVKIKCKCKNEQVVFDRASSEIKCLVCGELIAKPTGGKISMVARPLESLE